LAWTLLSIWELMSMKFVGKRVCVGRFGAFSMSGMGIAGKWRCRRGFLTFSRFGRAGSGV
jgi:hypothetical protein